jgi:hypothetical protein
MSGHHQFRLAEAMTVASSPDWSARAQAAWQMAPAADHDDGAQLLFSLLLDAHDTAVTDAACRARLDCGGIHAIRLLAPATGSAADEQLDHLDGAIAEILRPEGPVREFMNLCRELSQDLALAIREGARELISWAGEMA